MRILDYRESKIWINTLGAANKYTGTHEAKRAYLASEYSKFWGRISQVANKIASEFPNLTLHDENHFHALWHRASELTEDPASLNPLEAFILGGSILIHDVAHTVLAYDGGMDGIKASDAYKDSIAAAQLQIRQHSEKSIEQTGETESQIKIALFDAIRRLHAAQARKTVSDGFLGPDGTRIMLIEDQALRENLANTIGTIAESHHWDRQRVFDEMAVQGPPGDMPPEWSINTQYLAVLLRCADAIQIDQSRADRFSMSIHAPSGVSKLHWTAQNRIAQPIKDERTESSLKFVSTSPFVVDEAAAWWIAYDLIQVANSELRGCDELLRDNEQPRLFYNRISGASDPEKLEKFIRVDGWKPVKAEVKVTDVNRMIDLFGGEKLYGKDAMVPLRELIQNASDAIRARRAIDRSSDYVGRIDLTLEKNNDHYLFTVKDNGIGMSRPILTGPFLEFGKSFWASQDMRTEFPGLTAKNLDQTGRYGIGFFSVFMISSQVTVFSRRFDREEGANQLRFQQGTGMRPILLDANHKELGTASTAVRLRIDQTTYDEWHNLKGDPFQKPLELSLSERVAALCPTLDCDLYVNGEIAHSANWEKTDGLKWIYQVTPWARIDYTEEGQELLRTSADRLEVIRSKGVAVGRAMISTADLRLGQQAAGGIVTSAYRHGQSDNFIGVLPVKPTGPQRHNHVSTETPSVLAEWATNQAKLIEKLETDQSRHYYAAIHVSHFGGDVRPLACLRDRDGWKTAKQVASQICSGDVMYILKAVQSDIEYLSYPRYHMTSYSSMGLRVGADVNLEENILFAPWLRDDKKPYFRVQAMHYTFIGALESECKDLGFELLMKTEDRKIGKYIGMSSPREGLKKGKILKDSCLVLKSQKMSMTTP